MYVRELHVRYQNRWVAGSPIRVGAISTPKDAARLLAEFLGHEIVEVCGVLCLTNCNHVIAYHELSRGTLDATLVHPRDVFRTALLSNAGSVIVGHNHPSGEVDPSPDDVALTSRLKSAAAVVGVEFADHVIVGVDGRYFSFREAGRI